MTRDCEGHEPLVYRLVAAHGDPQVPLVVAVGEQEAQARLQRDTDLPYVLLGRETPNS